MSRETKQRTPPELPVVVTPAGTELRINENRFGSMEIKIEAVRLLNATGLATTQLESGSSLDVEIEYLASRPIGSPIFGITITREDNLICYDTNTASAGVAIPKVSGKGRIQIHFDRLDLNSGQYYLDVGVYERDWAYAYDYHWRVYPFQIHSISNIKGVLCPPSQWIIEHSIEAHNKLLVAVNTY